MNDWVKIAIGMVAWVTMAGCDLDLSLRGESSARLEDETRYGEPSSSTLESQTTLALGATLPLTIECGACAGETWDVRVDDPAVLHVEKKAGVQLELNGKVPGQTRLVLESASEVVETVVAVKPIAASHIRFYPWEPGLGLPSSLWSDGIAIFPSTNLWVGGCHLDESGNTLRGFGAKPWEIAGSTPDSGTIMLYEHADFGTYRSPSVPGHIDQIRLGEDAEASIQTVANHQAEVLELFVAKSLLEIEEGAIVEEGGVVESDSLSPVHGILRTAEGTYIAGAGEHALQLVREDTGESLLTDASDSEFGRILESGRAGLLADGLPKGQDIPAIARYGELSLRFTLRIAPELPEDPNLTP